MFTLQSGLNLKDLKQKKLNLRKINLMGNWRDSLKKIYRRILVITSKKKIAIIGTNGLPSNYGGFETLVDQLAQRINFDFEITIYCSKTPKFQQLIPCIMLNLSIFHFELMAGSPLFMMEFQLSML